MTDQTIHASNGTATEITAEIVAAYVSRNSIPAAELPALMRSIHETITGLGTKPSTEAAPEPIKPAVPIKRSVTPEYLISLETGQKFKSLKRHLTSLGMTFADYKAKWNLPNDYPSVCASYTETRSRLAKEIGLGSQRRKHGSAAQPEPGLPLAAEPPKRGRPKKAA